MDDNKKPWVAFALSFILPGAGLWYLQKWRAGWLNLVIVMVVLLVSLQLPLGQEVFEYFHYLVLVLMAASAGVAHAAATPRTIKPMRTMDPRHA
jgi:hypothetical protein